MAILKATWTKISDQEILRRSSHTFSIINAKAYIWGGELRPRDPRDNDVHVVDLKNGTVITISTQVSDPAVLLIPMYFPVHLIQAHAVKCLGRQHPPSEYPSVPYC